MSSTAVASQAEAYRAVLPDSPMPGKPLGRHIEHDPRSRLFPAPRASSVASVNHAGRGLPLRQLDVHICSTAHSLCAAINCSPQMSRTRQPLTEVDAVWIHDSATRRADFAFRRAGVGGNSALGACRAANNLGLIESYTHAFGIDHALHALVFRPVMTGIKWYSSFDSPDPDTGLVKITQRATIRGGHEVLVYGIDAERNVVWCWNSWGPKFGIGGRFSMSFDTWGLLLRERGDVTVPIV